MVFNDSNGGIFSSFYCIWLGGDNRFVDFSLEDPQAKKYSQSDMEGKNNPCGFAKSNHPSNCGRLQNTVKIFCPGESEGTDDCNHGLEEEKPTLVPKSVLKKKISGQDPTSKNPFPLDWDGAVTQALGVRTANVKILVVDPALKSRIQAGI